MPSAVSWWSNSRSVRVAVAQHRQFDVRRSFAKSCQGEGDVEAANRRQRPFAGVALEFIMADRFKEGVTRGFAFGEHPSFDLHHEFIAARRRALDQINLDFANAPFGMGQRAFGRGDLPAQSVLIVDMGGAQTFEAGDIGFDPGLVA